MFNQLIRILTILKPRTVFSVFYSQLLTGQHYGQYQGRQQV